MWNNIITTIVLIIITSNINCEPVHIVNNNTNNCFVDIGVQEKDIINAKNTFDAYLDDPARMIYIYFEGDEKVENILSSNLDNKIENSLTNWIWVHLNSKFLIQIPVDADAYTFGLLREGVYDLSIDLTIFGSSENCTFNKSYTADTLFNVLIKNITSKGMNKQGLLCNREFEKQTYLENMYRWTTLWEGYDFRCYSIETNDTIVSNVVKKSFSTRVVYIVDLIVFILYPYIFAYFCSEHHYDISSEYVEGDKPFSPQRFLNRILHSKKFSCSKQWCPIIKAVLVLAMLSLVFLTIYDHEFQKDVQHYQKYPSIYHFQENELYSSLRFFLFMNIYMLFSLAVFDNQVLYLVRMCLRYLPCPIINRGNKIVSFPVVTSISSRLFSSLPGRTKVFSYRVGCGRTRAYSDPIVPCKTDEPCKKRRHSYPGKYTQSSVDRKIFCFEERIKMDDLLPLKLKNDICTKLIRRGSMLLCFKSFWLGILRESFSCPCYTPSLPRFEISDNKDKGVIQFFFAPQSSFIWRVRKTKLIKDEEKCCDYSFSKKWKFCFVCVAGLLVFRCVISILALGINFVLCLSPFAYSIIAPVGWCIHSIVFVLKKKCSEKCSLDQTKQDRGSNQKNKIKLSLCDKLLLHSHSIIKFVLLFFDILILSYYFNGCNILFYWFKPIFSIIHIVIYTLFIAIPSLEPLNFGFFLIAFAVITYWLHFFNSFLEIYRNILDLMFKVIKEKSKTVKDSPRILMKDFITVTEQVFPVYLYASIFVLKCLLVFAVIAVPTIIVLESRDVSDAMVLHINDNISPVLVFLFSPSIFITIFFTHSEEEVKLREEKIREEIKKHSDIKCKYESFSENDNTCASILRALFCHRPSCRCRSSSDTFEFADNAPLLSQQSSTSNIQTYP